MEPPGRRLIFFAAHITPSSERMLRCTYIPRKGKYAPLIERTLSVCGRALTRIVRYQLGANGDGRGKIRKPPGAGGAGGGEAPRYLNISIIMLQ